ncbi:AB27G-like protein [Mya arenaria]|uniref:AB27G-like protein n=1 Tax=Mya arenaria TaxID=6604 RepID=A0ABY7DT01_MYAAR|nr:AB27G-like protein [Mya arenaria]
MNTNSPVLTLEVQHIYVHIDKIDVLQGISCSLKSGEICAIMGPTAYTSGSVMLNGFPFNKRLRRRLAFVQQEDVFFTHLTLDETIVTLEDKRRTINSIQGSLNLEKCKNTVIGNLFVKGLSGGEKKRASIACELLTDMDILLLDEPTSGLDSTTAGAVMQCLGNLAKEFNKMIVLTIHQPSSRIYQMFDTLLLLSDGQFFLKAKRFPRKLSIALQPVSNGKSDNGNARCQLLENTHSEYGSVTLLSETDSLIADTGVCLSEELLKTEKWSTSWWTQYKVLAWRSLKEQIAVLKEGYSLAIAVTVSVVCCFLFFKVGVSLQTARDIFVPAERPVISKERLAGSYRLSAYFLAKVTGDLPDTLTQPVFMYILFFWVANFGDAGQFFTILVVMLLQTTAAYGFGLTLSVLCTDARMAVTVLFSYLITTYALGGFFSQNVPYWMGWVKYTSVFYYPYAFAVSILLQDLPDTPCNQTSVIVFPQCGGNGTMFVTSGDILAKGNVHFPAYVYLFIIIAYTFILRNLGYVVMRFKRDTIV